MVSREVVLDTVKKMLSQGIEESVVESTLADIGMGLAEINEVMAEAKGIKPRLQAQKQETKNAAGARSASEEGKEAEEELEGTGEEEAEARNENPAIDQGLVNSSVHVAVETQGKQLEGINQNVSQLHEKLDSYSQASAEQISMRLTAIEKKIDELSASVSDSRALNSALQDLMQKILDANRRMLAELGKK